MIFLQGLKKFEQCGNPWSGSWLNICFETHVIVGFESRRHILQSMNHVSFGVVRLVVGCHRRLPETS